MPDLFFSFFHILEVFKHLEKKPSEKQNSVTHTASKRMWNKSMKKKKMSIAAQCNFLLWKWGETFSLQGLTVTHYKPLMLLLPSWVFAQVSPLGRCPGRGREDISLGAGVLPTRSWRKFEATIGRPCVLQIGMHSRKERAGSARDSWRLYRLTRRAFSSSPTSCQWRRADKRVTRSKTATLWFTLILTIYTWTPKRNQDNLTGLEKPWKTSIGIPWL